MTDIAFDQTMSGLIHRFRRTLRTLLPQDERMKKLKALGLRSSKLYHSSTLLYEAGLRIVEDIKQNFDTHEPGSYYAYDGLHEFSRFLSDYLDQFECHDCMIIHKSQVAAQSLLKAIQLLSPAKSRCVPSDVKGQIQKCTCVVASYGTDEQRQFLYTTLVRHRDQQPDAIDDPDSVTHLDACVLDRHFYESVLNLFDHYLPDQEPEQQEEAA